MKLSPKLIFAVSMAIFGTVGLFTRNIPVGSGEIALYRAAFAGLTLIVYLMVSRKKIDWTALKKEVLIIIMSGVAMGFNWILLFQAYEYTTISVATLCYYFAPVIVTVVCALIFHEKLTKKQIFCFSMSTVGLVLIVLTGDITSGGNTAMGILCGLGAAVLYAVVMLCNKFVKYEEDISRTLVQFLAATVVLSPYVGLTSGFHMGSLGGTGWACLLTLAVFHTGIVYCFYFGAMKHMSGQEVSILCYIDPLVAVLVSMVIFGEAMTLLQAIGGVLILGFTLLNEIGPRKDQEA